MASVSVDLMEYIPILERGQREWLINELHQYCQDLPVATPIKALRFRLAAYQVERQLGWQARVTETGTVLLTLVSKETGQMGGTICYRKTIGLLIVFNCGLFINCCSAVSLFYLLLIIHFKVSV